MSRPRNPFLIQYFKDNPKATAKEAAEASGLTVSSVRNFCSNGKAPSGGKAPSNRGRGRRLRRLTPTSADQVMIMVGGKTISVETLLKVREAAKAVASDIGSNDPRSVPNAMVSCYRTVNQLAKLPA